MTSEIPIALSVRLRERGLDRVLSWLDLPIPAGVADGSLPMEDFRHYLEQDYLYLKNFTRYYAKLAVVGPDHLVGEFLGLAWNVQSIEMIDQRDTAESFGCDFEAAVAAPTTAAYTSFLLGSADDYARGLVAALPCVWGYAEALSRIPATHAGPFRPWLETYAGGDYAQVVDRHCALIDDIDLPWDVACALFDEAMGYEEAFWSQQASTTPNGRAEAFA